MKIEEHEKAYKEHLNSINKCIEEGIDENQRNIGYNISQGSVELLSIFLHKLNLLQAGDQLDHRVFKNKSLIQKRIPPEFPEKANILEIMKAIELERNVICYGTRKPKERIEKVITLFNELRGIVNKNLKPEQNGRKK
jgi:hypothetical protein